MIFLVTNLCKIWRGANFFYDLVIVAFDYAQATKANSGNESHFRIRQVVERSLFRVHLVVERSLFCVHQVVERIVHQVVERIVHQVVERSRNHRY
jgi:hypothetical protein